MTPRWILAALLALMIGAPTVAVPASAAKPADLILFNGKVVTVDRAFSIRSAVVIKDGRILAVGGSELLKAYRAPRRIDLAGRMLMPGFIDTHLHLFGLSHRQIEPDKARSIADIRTMVTAKAHVLGPGQWVTGYGWDEAQLAEHRVLTRADLDAAAPDNPVVLTRAGSHSIVANSRAFALAHIDATTPDPPTGLIERDSAGRPTGIIRERTDLILSLVPPDTAEQMRPSYVASLKALLPLGVTSFMEALTNIDDEPYGKGGAAPGERKANPIAGHSWRDFQAIYALYGEELPRIACYIFYPGPERLKAFPYHTGYGNDRIKLGPIGEMPGYDGGFTGPTAFTKQDYKGLPGFRGRAMLTPASAQAMVDDAASHGWQLGIHAIGDAAIEQMAQVYDRALKAHPKRDHRWFLAHLTMLPSDATLDMLARDHVAAAVQPNFLYALEGRYEQTLDGRRLEHINPLATPIAHGVRLAFGSDNLPIGPLVGLHGAITRKGPDGKVFGADEAVSRRQAIRLYTRDAAYLTWDEAKKGSIEPGKFADMIVLDRDLLTVPAAEILDTRILTTIIGGKIVYQRQ